MHAYDDMFFVSFLENEEAWRQLIWSSSERRTTLVPDSSQNIEDWELVDIECLLGII